MPFTFGLTAEKSNSTSSGTTNGSFNTTKTPVLPEWATNLTTGVAGRVGSLMSLDPKSLVAPEDPLQSQAAKGAANLTGQWWNYDGAADLARGAAKTSWLDGYMNSATPSASAARASDYVGGYLNPYLRQVVDSTGADLDASDGRVRAQQALDLAGSGAFGGSGAALTQSLTEGELSRARAAALGSLRSHAYDSALAAAGGDAERSTQASIASAQAALQDRQQKVDFGLQGQQQQLAASRQLSDLAGAFEQNLRGDIATQAAIGGTLRDINQQALAAPVTSTQQMVALLTGMPIGMFAGEESQGTSQENSSSKSSGTKVGASLSVPFP